MTRAPLDLRARMIRAQTEARDREIRAYVSRHSTWIEPRGTKQPPNLSEAIHNEILAIFWGLGLALLLAHLGVF